jgi:hypothetical protein
LVNQCPHCQHPDESIDHVWLCPSRTESNKKIVNEFLQFLEKENTYPEIITAFGIALNHWFRIKQKFTPEDRKHHLWETIEKQRDIGWKYFVRGLLINDWACWQERHDPQKLGDSWSASISAWWITQSRKIWTQRNDKLHQHTKDNKSITEQETFAQIWKLYDMSSLLSANDRELFDLPLEDLLKHPIRSLQTWVKTAWPTVKICVQNHTERLVNDQKKLSEIFRPIQQHNNNTSVEDEITTIAERESQLTTDQPKENEPTPQELHDILNLENEHIIVFESTSNNDNIFTNLSTLHNMISLVNNPFP